MDQISTPFFFTNFPEEVGWGDLWKLFARYGSVVDVFIPKKVDKWGRKFGFVKFKEVKEVESLSNRPWQNGAVHCQLQMCCKHGTTKIRQLHKWWKEFGRCRIRSEEKSGKEKSNGGGGESPWRREN
ncbi:hypothetical protein TSUD_236570 [Trifolium subterraneum]|uniref:RRM domain-containing protein n=1 Tax=Trifolium subterraneum TaxID=3900 RepID=A0A2Z6PQ42_TRISU|nr:hypothetical protein TSUD_236570 [Trifolium subterraneum]